MVRMSLRPSAVCVSPDAAALERAELFARHVDAAILPDRRRERPELPAALLASHPSSPLKAHELSMLSTAMIFVTPC